MKIQGYDLKWKDALLLIGHGLLGLFFCLCLSFLIFWKFTLWFGKLFMKLGKYYGEKIDKSNEGRAIDHFKQNGIEVIK